MCSRSILFRCGQSRRRPVNDGGERLAELHVGVLLEERELLLFSDTAVPASARGRVPRPRSLPSGLARFD
jgi:hypothetical protein